MTELMRRRRAMMGAQSGGGVTFPLVLYNEGAISPVAGDFTDTGYKYGSNSNFSQSKEADHLLINSLTGYNNRGGRTFTTQLPIPAACVGKTLRVTATQTNKGTADATDMRQSFARVYVSEQVVDNSQVEAVADSGCFVNSIYDNQAIRGKNTTINVNLSLSLTQSGYVSVMTFKGYGGFLDFHITKIWIE